MEKNLNIKIILLKVCLILSVIVIDLITKIIFYGKDITIFASLISFRNAHRLNTGGAWGIFSQGTIMLICFTIIFLIGIVFFDFRLKIKHKLYSISFAFIVGGAIGNLIDRIFLGGVRDFIFFEFAPNFPTFNFADSFLTIGLILMFIYVIFCYKANEEGNKENKDERIDS